MPWFKIDDGFATSEPVMRVPRRYRASVIGLWTLSGTWCAKELTDGRLPFHMLDELAGTKAQAAQLVACGLWRDTPEGYVFIGWDKYQPTREKVEADRKREAERKASYRKSHRDTSGTDGGQTEGHQAESEHPDPTRPDPTLKEERKSIVQDKPAPDLASEFESWWQTYPRKQGKADALKAFKVARKKHPLKTLMAGAQAYALLNIGAEKEFLKLPGGWLRGERWEDEQIVNSTRTTTTNQPAECSIHRNYPLPCDACARDANEGREF